MKDRVLDAAEAVVVRSGIANLTLDAVAAEAGVSKGGLLHHYPSKDSLVEGMVIRCAERWRTDVLQTFEDTPPGPGRMARALLSELRDPEGWSEHCAQSSSAAFAALMQNPNLIEPLRATYESIRARFEGDGLEPGAGETILLAMDGLWLNRVLGLAPVDGARMTRVRQALERLLDQPRRAAPRTRTPAAKPARAKVRHANSTRPQAKKK